LDFPENVNFLELTGEVEESESGEMLMRKNFVVETAEYVTTKGQKYAQIFILQNPIKLERVDLALHNFGGKGQLWIELHKDDGQGRPGQYLASSEIKPLNSISKAPGYRWVGFHFPGNELALPPGQYWIALGYTGSPIVNWFFTYGKPVGPVYGTRYNTMFDETWSRSLTYEFNYRVIGKAPQ